MRAAAILSISLLVNIGSPYVGTAQGPGPRASYQFHDVSLRASLDSLMNWFPVSIVYLDRNVEGKVVTASCSDCSFDDALNSILNGSSLTWLRIGSQVILKDRNVEKSRQHATISGVVTDSLTGEWIVGANVLLQDSANQEYIAVSRWCPTSSYGFFSLRRVSPGNYTLVLRALGYRTRKMPLSVTADQPLRCDVSLVQEEITLQEVTIEGQRSSLTSAEGISRGIYIRSTPSDQKHYLLDGAQIYNPAHFGGVLSTFNDEALNDVQVMVGGLPPYYGGRIGGILDLSLRDGTMQRFSGSAGTGSLGSTLSFEGPLGGSTTYMVSGRRGYPEAAVPFLQEEGTPSHLGSSEMIAKLTHRLSGSSRLSLSGYLGRDSYTNTVDGAGECLNNNFSWGNSALNLRWIAIASPSLFLHASAVFTRYDFTLDHLLSGDSFLPTGARFSSDFAIEDVSLRAHAEHYYDEEHTVRGGVELVHHQMRGTISEFSSRTAPLSLGDVSSWEMSVYLQDQWKILPRVMAEIGGRATSFTGDRGSFSAIDPRFSLLFTLDESTRLYTSITTINQFIHPYRNSGVFLLYPTIFWYPSNEQARPSTSVQLTLGVEEISNDDAYVVSAESFYRNTHNLHEFGLDTTASPIRELSTSVLLGTGKSYGLEITLRKRTGDLTGTVGYTLSWDRHTVPELNGGEPFAPPFDRRHELQIALSYTLGPRWALGALCIVASDQSPSFDPLTVQAKSSDIVSGRRGLPEYDRSQLPGFQRLEFSVLHYVALWGLPCQFSLRFLNSYGLLDPFDWELLNSIDPRSKWRARVEELKLFPMFPTLGFTVRF